MSLQSYLFGGDTGLSYDQLQKRRKVLDAMMARQNAAPQNVGEGINAFGNGILQGLERRKLRKAEEAMSGKTDGLWNDVSGLVGGAPASQVATPSFGASADPAAGSNTAQMSAADPAVYDQFISTVQAGGVKNPNALAAIAATGQAESGYSPANAYGEWSDPSQSGQAGQAGGIMSWRAERLANMRQFAEANGDDPSRPSPATQAKFLLQEDPALIERLNAAGSVEEAQSLMNGAWRFAGYDQPDGESARRLATAQAYLPKFAGQQQPVEVASLDPAAGMEQPAPAPTGMTATPQALTGQGKTIVDGTVQDANAAPFLRNDGPNPMSSEGLAQEQAAASGMAYAPPTSPASPVRQALDTARQTVEARVAPSPAAVSSPPAMPSASPAADPWSGMRSADPAAGRQRLAQVMTERGIPVEPAAAPRQSVQNVARAMEQMPQAQDPRIASAMGSMRNPAASPEQRAIAGSVLEQAMKPQEYGFQTLPDGTILRTDPRTGTASPIYQGRQKPIEVDGALLDPETYQPVYQAPRDPMAVNEGQALVDRDGREVYRAQPKAPQRTDDQREYEFARTQGYSGNFVDFQRDMKQAGATNVTVGGQSSKFRDEADKRMVTRFGDIADAGQSAASVTQTMPYMRELLTQAPSGPVAGRLAETFPGFSTAGDAFQATVNQIAPTLRIPGSGAQSDRDMDILMGSLPRLRNDLAANGIILDAFAQKADLNLRKSQVATSALRGEIDPAEADRQMGEIDRTSILPESFRRVLGGRDGQAPAPVGAGGAAKDTYRSKYGLE